MQLLLILASAGLINTKLFAPDLYRLLQACEGATPNAMRHEVPKAITDETGRSSFRTALAQGQKVLTVLHKRSIRSLAGRAHKSSQRFRSPIVADNGDFSLFLPFRTCFDAS